MAFYKKAPNQLLIDLINEANPNVSIDLRTLQNTRLGNPVPYPTLRQQQTLRVVKAYTAVGDHVWIPPKGVTHVDVLVVGGGGAGGGEHNISYHEGGGGGAGGLVFVPNHPVGHQERVTVGKGANGGLTPEYIGGSSKFGENITALGGGTGGGMDLNNPAGFPGGSSGGYGLITPHVTLGLGNGRAMQPRQFGLSGQYGHGNTGGIDLTGVIVTAQGGGGAGDDGFKTGAEAGNGGDGLCKVTPDAGVYDREYRFAEVFGTDHGEVIDGDAWFAGGGGGGDNYPRLGGKGGGGHGQTYSYVVPGTAGTGGGGGGKTTSKYAEGAPGGSGIVLIAYNNPRVNNPDFKYQTVNTEIDIWPSHDLPFQGKVTLYYRRIILQDFFKYRQVKFERWTESNQLTTAQLLELYNAEFGTKFIEEDFPNTTFGPSPNPQQLQVLSTSLTYLGYLEFIWNPNERELDQILETDTINGYVWDPRYTSEPMDTKPYYTFVGWGFDFSLHYNNLINYLSSGATVNATLPVLNGLVELYNRVCGTALTTSVSHTVPNGLAGLTVMRYTLPNNTVDEANHIKFNNVYVIRAQSNSWFTGSILFHYNPK